MTQEMEGLMGLSRLKDHYKVCIRLSASNKINPKNAFDLRLIDYMQDLVSTTEDGQMNFKIASSALDVGAKIYSNRVDCIQSEAQKVASSILMALDDPQKSKGKAGDDLDQTEANANDSNASDGLNDSKNLDADGQRKANKKKRNQRSKSIKTITEESNLDAKLEQMVIGDAFLDGLSRDYDMSCPAALICYNALTQPNCLLTIESNYSRTDYREKSSIIKTSSETSEADPKPKNLETISEEKEEIEAEGSVQEEANHSTKADVSVEHQEDPDGDCIMKDGEEAQTNSDKTTASTAVSAATAILPSSTTMPSSQLLFNTLPNNSNVQQTNYVTLITKHANCAQIIRNNSTNKVCPRLDTFLFNDRTTSITGLNSNIDDTMPNFDQQQPNLNSSKITGGAHEFNPELYDDGDDHFGDAESVMGDADVNSSNDRVENLIPNLDKIAATKPTDYGYSTDHHRLVNTWAGPHGWRTMKAPGTTKKDAPKSTRKRTKLEQVPIDFSEESLASLEKLADKEIRHSAESIKRWKKPLFPQDHNLSEDTERSRVMQKFQRPEETYHCQKSPADVFKLVGKDHSYLGENGDDPMDAETCPPSSPLAIGGFDDVHDDSDDEFRADPVLDGNEVAIYGAQINNPLTQQEDLEFAGENLIEQPYTVAQVNIPFAKIAKKMDVRRLKRVMWDLLLPPDKRLELSMQMQAHEAAKVDPGNNQLSNDGDHLADADKTDDQSANADEQNQTVVMANNDENMINVSSDPNNPSKKTPSPTPSESAVHLEFSNLYGELPVRISSKMATDLSQSIAFVTLLHLANEKNLKLIPKQDLKDFIIEQDEVL